MHMCMHTGAVDAISCESRVACAVKTAGRVHARSKVRMAVVSLECTLIDIC